MEQRSLPCPTRRGMIVSRVDIFHRCLETIPQNRWKSNMSGNCPRLKCQAASRRKISRPFPGAGALAAGHVLTHLDRRVFRDAKACPACRRTCGTAAPSEGPRPVQRVRTGQARKPVLHTDVVVGQSPLLRGPRLSEQAPASVPSGTPKPVLHNRGCGTAFPGCPDRHAPTLWDSHPLRGAKACPCSSG